MPRPTFRNRLDGDNPTPPAPGIVGTAGVWVDLTPADMDMTQPYGGVSGQDNFGTVGMGKDPSTQYAYFGGSYQGLWETTDYGTTWTKVWTSNFSTGPYRMLWGCRFAPDGSYMLNQDGGGSLGLWRSTDRGRSWTRPTWDGGADLSADVQICPDDKNICMAMGHGNGAVWNWSTDAGLTFTNTGLGTPSAGDFGNGIFISATVFLVRSPSGLFKMTLSGGTWTSQTAFNTVLEGPHGGTQFFHDRVGHYVYFGGLKNSGSDSGTHIWRSPDTDLLTWTNVADAGFGYGCATIWGSPNRIFAMGNYGTTGSYGPMGATALLSAPTSWSDYTSSMPAGMFNGPHAACVVTDGTRYRHLLSCDRAGIWGYIEP